ncbi:radical SAM family heme chaperone HemW [Aurantibacillus circumpalustris]|uniref:radical SAM family heme chaperone HemW n=1 Tax=Aurantibacillus circumpalustris TaxID=3036359 RepID=UPI00295A6DCA|nr:radical SAM family heme chaperone HemW [Aurantibacillus circumpalustris]
MSGVYIHIPFCKKACSYCDFFFSTNLSSKENLVKALNKEINLRSDYLSNKNLDSIYFGGGTPSLLSHEELRTVLETLKSHFTFGKNIEITLEVNPDDITTKSLRDWFQLGFNRLSIGLQSFDDEELKWMNRAHTATESLASVKLAQDAGFNNLTIDLIYGSKFQSLKTWEKTLTTAMSLETQHISSYNLTIENKTALGVNFNKGIEPPVSDDLSSKQFIMMADAFEDAGFVHYEISNFGKPNFFAKHNSNYWLQQAYLGIGPSAHSFNGNSRQWNVSNNSSYIKSLDTDQSFFEKEELSVNNRYNEYVLTRLRTIWGCDLNEIKAQFGEVIAKHFKNGILVKKNFLIEKNKVFTLTKSAKLQADGIASDLFILD